MGVRRASEQPRTRRLLSLREVEESLGVSNRFLRLEIKRGKLATIKLGRRRLVDTADLDEYIARHREGRTT